MFIICHCELSEWYGSERNHLQTTLPTTQQHVHPQHSRVQFQYALVSSLLPLTKFCRTICHNVVGLSRDLERLFNKFKSKRSKSIRSVIAKMKNCSNVFERHPGVLMQSQPTDWQLGPRYRKSFGGKRLLITMDYWATDWPTWARTTKAFIFLGIG